MRTRSEQLEHWIAAHPVRAYVAHVAVMTLVLAAFGFALGWIGFLMLGVGFPALTVWTTRERVRRQDDPRFPESNSRPRRRERAARGR